MTGADVALLALGAYVTSGLFISAWRRVSEAAGGVSIWGAACGIWTIAACARWLESTPWLLAAVALMWGACGYAVTCAGGALGRRMSARRWAWWLGPVHAVGLAVTWLADTQIGRRRRRRATVRGPAARAPGVTARAGEAFASVIELGETTVEEVMVPRSAILALPHGARVRDWARAARASRHPHLPVQRRDLDDIVGYVSLVDLFSAPGLDLPVTRYLRDVRFVPQSMRCDDLLRELISHDERIAIAVDEFGGTAGLVRERDLFEILLGEIDRGSAGEGALLEVARGVYLVDGQMRIDDFNALVPGTFPTGDYETLGGLVINRLGRIPAEGEPLVVAGVRIDIVGATPRRILKLRVALSGSAGGSAGGPAARVDASGDAGGSRRGDRHR